MLHGKTRRKKITLPAATDDAFAPVMKNELVNWFR